MKAGSPPDPQFNSTSAISKSSNQTRAVFVLSTVSVRSARFRCRQIRARQCPAGRHSVSANSLAGVLRFSASVLGDVDCLRTPLRLRSPECPPSPTTGRAAPAGPGRSSRTATTEPEAPRPRNKPRPAQFARNPRSFPAFPRNTARSTSKGRTMRRRIPIISGSSSRTNRSVPNISLSACFSTNFRA